MAKKATTTTTTTTNTFVQDTTATTIKALTEKINWLKAGAVEVAVKDAATKEEGKAILAMERMESEVL